jgi:hypothetical protein
VQLAVGSKLSARRAVVEFGRVFAQRIGVVIRNGLEQRIPGLERISLGLGVASAEKDWRKKTETPSVAYESTSSEVRHILV